MASLAIPDLSLLRKFVSMCFLLKLDKYILIAIVLDWVDLTSFGLLSASLTNHRLAIDFTEFVKQFSEKLKSHLFPSAVFLSVRIETLNWFEKFNFGTPDRILLERDTYKLLDRGVFKFAQSVLSGKYRKQNNERKCILDCLGNSKHILIQEHDDFRKLTYCKNVESVEVRHGLGQSSGILLPICGPQIRVLNLTGFKFDSENFNCMVCRSCPNLNTFLLTRYQAFTRSLLATLLVHCRQLSTLHISSRDDIDDRWIQQFVVFRRCHVIHLPFTNVTTLRTLLWYQGSVQQSLSMLNTQEIVLDEMVLSCSELKSLTIRGIYATPYEHSSPALLHLACKLMDLHICETQFQANYFDALPECPQLTTLRLFDCQLTSGVLTTILARCSQVKNLIVGINELDDTIAEALVFLSHLRRLDLSKNQITDTLLLRLSRQCRGLTTLDVKQCTLVTDVGVCSIVMNGRLNYLDVTDCSLLTESTFACVANHCPDIRFLQLSGSPDFLRAIDADVVRCRKCFTYCKTIR